MQTNTWLARLSPIYPPPAVTHPGLRVICSVGCTKPHWTPAAEAFRVDGEAPFTYCCFQGVGDSRWATMQLHKAARDYSESLRSAGAIPP
jgi:hypothetical protein